MNRLVTVLCFLWLFSLWMSGVVTFAYHESIYTQTVELVCIAACFITGLYVILKRMLDGFDGWHKKVKQ